MNFIHKQMDIKMKSKITDGLAQYKFFLLLALLSFTFLIICDIICYKIVQLGPLVQPASAFMYPVSYIIGDMIAEIYGYKLARQLIWYSLLCQLLFAVAITLFISLPSPEYWHLQSVYNAVLGGLFRQAIASTLGIAIGLFVNAYLISTLKIRMHGKKFWVRNLFATAVGEGIVCVVCYTILFYDKYPLQHLMHFMASAWVYKCLYATLMVGPVSLIVSYIKSKEGFDVYDYRVNYNPFKLSTE